MHSKFWLAIKNHHIKHHFQAPDKGYGVSSPLWDLIFGTTFKDKKEQKT
jgi:sterol desaturase/sphingolipid hydroxylase (fatty acid hydroxylase superfamily)